MSVAAYEAKRWRLWKFALGGTVISGVGYLVNLKGEAAFYRSMNFNTAEIALQVIGYVIAGTFVALIIAAIQNVWVWHSTGNRGLARTHAVLAAVVVLLIVLMLGTLDPYSLV